MQTIRCAEIWGGIRNADLDVCTSGVTASLYSAACDGGKGGDIYYFSVCASDLLTRVVVADVVGHGPPVADMSQWIYDTMVTHMNDADGRTLLADLNVAAAGRGFEAMTTAAVVAFYRADNHLYVSYAGHPPLYVRHANDAGWHPVSLPPDGSAANLPLAVLDDTVYCQTRLALRSGDRLFVYTDGLTEAPSPDGDLFGEQRLKAALECGDHRSLTDIKSAILAAAHDHTGGPMTHDDVTLLVMEVN